MLEPEHAAMVSNFARYAKRRSPGIITYPDIYTRGSTGSFTLRHKVELSRASGDKLDSANHTADIRIIKE